MIKRITATAVILCLLFSSGCGEKKVTALDLIGKPFTCRVDISVLTMDFSGEFTKTDGENMSLTLDKPALLTGMKFAKNGDDVSLSVFGLTVSIENAAPESTSAADVLFDIFSGDGDYDVEYGESAIIMRRKTGLDTVIVEFDKGTLVPVRLHTENTDIVMTFSEYKLIE